VQACLKHCDHAILQDGTPFTSYSNIRRSQDGLNWQATLSLPGKQEPLVVGQHRQQVVAACMADDAARAAGLMQQVDLNFDDVTKQMVSANVQDVGHV
jgi:DNA-binding FadR family transcriptional regulator